MINYLRTFMKRTVLPLYLRRKTTTRVGLTPSGMIVGASMSEKKLYFADREEGRLLPWSRPLRINENPNLPITCNRPRLLGVDRRGALYLQNVDGGLQIVRISETVEVMMDMPTILGMKAYKPLLKDLEVSYGMGEVGFDWFGDEWLLDVSAIQFHTAPLWDQLAGPRPVLAAAV